MMQHNNEIYVFYIIYIGNIIIFSLYLRLFAIPFSSDNSILFFLLFSALSMISLFFYFSNTYNAVSSAHFKLDDSKGDM